MVPALLVHHAHVRRQEACLRERSVVVEARVIPALLVYRANVPMDLSSFAIDPP